MKAVLTVIDSFGLGAMPDAEYYGDAGANTALHITRNVDAVEWPTLSEWGLGNCAGLLGHQLTGVPARKQPTAHYGVMKEQSPGKDTTTGHWELAGIILKEPFRTFEPGYPSFPVEILDPVCRKYGFEILGNRAASGTEIIEELGPWHLNSGDPIVYTSADSVLQVATHERLIPVETLYAICRDFRKECDPFNVGRVIARPFDGSPGAFFRTERRKDFNIALPFRTLMDVLSDNRIPTIAIGKISNIFNGAGISGNYPEIGNSACLNRTLEVLKEKRKAESLFLFANYVDTDMIYGHRRNVQGYHDAVAEIDRHLNPMLDHLDPGDLLIVTADHGCDPTFPGSDHTREYVPLLVLEKGCPGRNLGVRESFSDLAQSMAHFFGVESMESGKSFF